MTTADGVQVTTIAKLTNTTIAEKIPKTKSGANTEAKFARKAHAVVKEVLKIDFIARSIPYESWHFKASCLFTIAES
jgi:hypothetical protein